jgi:multisubunit Na+/H+ antiporter MnhG subunit
MILVALMTALLAAPASAQMLGREGPKQEKPKEKKYDDKDYKSALERLPDQKFDPWRNMR